MRKASRHDRLGPNRMLWIDIQQHLALLCIDSNDDLSQLKRDVRQAGCISCGTYINLVEGSVCYRMDNGKDCCREVSRSFRCTDCGYTVCAACGGMYLYENKLTN